MIIPWATATLAFYMAVFLFIWLKQPLHDFAQILSEVIQWSLDNLTPWCKNGQNCPWTVLVRPADPEEMWRGSVMDERRVRGCESQSSWSERVAWRERGGEDEPWMIWLLPWQRRRGCQSRRSTLRWSSRRSTPLTLFMTKAFKTLSKHSNWTTFVDYTAVQTELFLTDYNIHALAKVSEYPLVKKISNEWIKKDDDKLTAGATLAS